MTKKKPSITPEKPLEDLLTIPQVAEKLNVPVATAYRYVQQKAIPSIRVGKHLRVRPSAVQQYLAERE